MTEASADGRKPAAVVQGYAAEVGWAELAEGCVAVRGGALLGRHEHGPYAAVAAGPVARQRCPGRRARDGAGPRSPTSVVGKPAPTLFASAAARVGARRPLVVGDRLDTDIEGAVRAGFDSLLVLTGVSTAADVLVAPSEARPTCDRT